MKPLNDKHFANAVEANEALRQALKPLRVLKGVSWPDEFRHKFLKDGILPSPSYDAIDIQPSLELVKQAKTLINGDHVVFDWLSRLASRVEITAHMLSARGTKEFSKQSELLFGTPSRLMLDRKTRVIDMARHMDDALEGLDVEKLVVKGYETFMSAEDFADELRPLLIDHFGSDAPDIVISENLTAKAVAGSKRIRIRAGARFSNRDVDQLLQHEALVHVATALNGRAQVNFPILGRSHGGVTEVQEGLAVFAEMISGAMDPVRFHRLSNRVITIQMSLDGADFQEIYQYNLDQGSLPEEAYENTRRIFRGGLIAGGAPFTKDMVYLNGLLRVHNFMRTVVKLGRADLIRLLFVGKLDLEDVPALAHLASHGQINGPKFMPPWAKDLRFLVSYLAYSSFLNQVKMPGFQAYYEDRLADVPVVWDAMG